MMHLTLPVHPISGDLIKMDGHREIATKAEPVCFVAFLQG
jgi:hypothetical protein